MTTKSNLVRNISHTQPQKVMDLKERISDNVKYILGKPRFLQSVSNSTTLIPNMDDYGLEFKGILLSTIIDDEMEEGLKENQVIGWCRLIKKFYALKTPGDGNCLLHAVCQYLWGVTDSSYQLRDLLYITMVEDSGKKIYRRWTNEQAFLDSSIPEFQYSSMEWQRDWDIMVRIAESLRPNQQVPGLPSDSLEDVHVFVLCNVLRRPIIILSDPVLRNAFGQSFGPNNFGGVYLPLMWEPLDCCKHPIVLGFYSNHFFPLVNVANQRELGELSNDKYFAVPLVTHDLQALRIHYLLPEEEKNAMDYLQRYFILTEIEQYDAQKGEISKILAAKLADKYEETSIMADYVSDCHNKFIKGEPIIQSPTDSVTENLISFNDASAPPESLTNVSYPTHPLPSGASQLGPRDINYPPSIQKSSATDKNCSSKGCSHKAAVTTHPFCVVCFDKSELLSQMPDSLKEKLLNGSDHQTQEEMLPEENLYSIDPSSKRDQPIVNIPVRTVDTMEETQKKQDDHFLLEKSHHICIEKDCKEVAIEHLDHLCMRHYYAAANQQIRNVIRPVETVEKSKIRKCRMKGCTAAGYESTDYLCSKHLSQLHSATALTGETSAGNSPKQENSEPQIDYCSTEGCERISAENPFKMCDICFKWVQGGKEPAEEVKANKDRKIPKRKIKAEFTSSATPVFTGPREETMSQVPLGTQLQICINPICGNRASMSCNGLCYVCFNILCDAAARRNNIQASRASTGGVRQTPCAMESCPRFSQPGLYGYCGRCYDQLVQIRYPSNPINNLNVIRTVTNASMSVQSNRCLSENCRKMGDENLQGLCQDCYRMQMLRFSQLKHENLVRRVEQRIDQSRSRAQSSAAIDRKYNRVMTEKETSSHHTTGKCKNQSCTSFGNSKCFGYCNQCYPFFSL